MPPSPEDTTPTSKRFTAVDERELGSGPGIIVLIGALAAYLAGVLLARGGGLAEVWTAVGLFVLGTGCHSAGWRYKGAFTTGLSILGMQKIAQTAERGKSILLVLE